MHFFFSSFIPAILLQIVLPRGLIQQFDLRGILEYQLQAVLGMIFDFSMQFNLFAFERLRLQFIFLKQFRGRCKDNCGERLPGRTKIQKIGITLGGVAYTKNSTADAGLISRQSADFFHLTGLHQWHIGLDLSRRRRQEAHTKAWRVNVRARFRIFFLCRILGELPERRDSTVDRANGKQNPLEMRVKSPIIKAGENCFTLFSPRSEKRPCDTLLPVVRRHETKVGSRRWSCPQNASSYKNR